MLVSLSKVDFKPRHPSMLHICLASLEPGVSKELPNWDDAAE